jgi:hypothetical protein
VPSPHDIEAEIRGLRGAETLTFAELRQRLAARHAADGTCPVMTSMNLRVVAEIALAELDDGMPADAVTEVWRAIDPHSTLARKLPGGPDRIEHSGQPSTRHGPTINDQDPHPPPNHDLHLRLYRVARDDDGPGSAQRRPCRTAQMAAARLLGVVAVHGGSARSRV